MRAKFKVDSVTRYAWNPANAEVKLSPVYSNDPNSENKAFWDATPSGSISLNIANANAAAYLELGKEYYIDFTKVE